jgi:hypothetical protein
MPNKLQLSAVAALFAGTLVSSPVVAMTLPLPPELPLRSIVLAQHGGQGFSGYGGHGFSGYGGAGFNNGYRGYGYGGGGYYHGPGTSPTSGSCSGAVPRDCGKPRPTPH